MEGSPMDPDDNYMSLFHHTYLNYSPNYTQTPLPYPPNHAITLPPHPNHVSAARASSLMAYGCGDGDGDGYALGFDPPYIYTDRSMMTMMVETMEMPPLVEVIHSSDGISAAGKTAVTASEVAEADGRKRRGIRRSLEGSLNLHNVAGTTTPGDDRLPKRVISQQGSSCMRAQGGGSHEAHVSIERNRRKQMNDHIRILRSLMPASYAQRGDQASVIGAVVDFVKELEQLVASLEAQKRRRECVADAMSGARGRPAAPPPPDPPSRGTASDALTQSIHHDASDALGGSAIMTALRRSEIAEVEVKVAGGSEVSLRALCVSMATAQLSRLVSTLERLNLRVLHLTIATPHPRTLLYTFALKIGIDCKLSVDDLADIVQQTFKDIRSEV